MRPLSVLFLCTGNSARSILAEAYLNAKGAGRFVAFSAGSHPAGVVNPFALDLLQKRHIDTENLCSKSWDEFSEPDAPKIDFIITVCDNAAGEVCPVWPGKPTIAHWGTEDPAAVQGTDETKRKAFLKAFTELSSRIDRLISLPVERLGTMALRLSSIGITQNDWSEYEKQ